MAKIPYLKWILAYNFKVTEQLLALLPGTFYILDLYTLHFFLLYTIRSCFSTAPYLFFDNCYSFFHKPVHIPWADQVSETYNPCSLF